MVTTRLYLDSRYVYATDSEAPIKIQITKRGKTALLSTGVRVLPDQWDKPSLRIVRHPSKASLNVYLAKLKIRVDEIIRDLVLSGEAADMSVVEIKNIVEAEFMGRREGVTFGAYLERFLQAKTTQTAGVYTGSVRVLYKFDPKAEERPLQEFSSSWAERWASWLSDNYSANSRKTYVSNLSAIFNKAVSERLVSSNPFSGIKLSYVVTKKRNLSQAQFRTLWNIETRTEAERAALDLFKFSFLTIAMNPADIATLTEDNIFNGRIEYDRAKTGRHYSVKIVPELEPLLKTRRKGRLLFVPFPFHKDYKSALSYADKLLAAMSVRAGLPRATIYWGRHSWASFAAELDVPIDVISSALGHSHGSKVTMIYINVDLRKVDDAARRVIDYALYDDPE